MSKTGSKSGKTRVAVLYGGRSGEHEVSLRSAASVIRELDRTRFEVIPIGIDKSGQWHLLAANQLDAKIQVLPLPPESPKIQLPTHPSQSGTPEMIPVGHSAGGKNTPFDVVFPAMHGTFCEDGTLQGLLEIADVPYVGCGVLSSSVGMDKDVAKRLARDAGIPIVPFITVRPGRFQHELSGLIRETREQLGFPVFVKPSNSGSSVGVHKVKKEEDLQAALKDAFQYDSKVLIEKAVSAREIEFAVLEGKRDGDAPRVSIAGEIVPKHEFYSYEAKYLDDNGADLSIPAKLTEAELAEGRELAAKIFVALECEGMARVDLFLDRVSGKFYMNEINTLPGFTSISMYPKLWEKSGLGYGALLTELVDLALARHERRSRLVRDFTPAT